MPFRIRQILALTALCAIVTALAVAPAPAQSLRSGGYFCGTDGSCQWFKPGDSDWLFERFTYVMGYADCSVDIATWRTKNPDCRLVLYTSGSDMPSYKMPSSNSYNSGQKSTWIRERMVQLGETEEHTYLHFYEDTELRHWNGSGYDTLLIPGTYSTTIDAADSVSRVPNSYVNALFINMNTYEYPARLSPNFTNPTLRQAYKEYLTHIFNSEVYNHWPGATGTWDGVYFDNYSPLGMVGSSLCSGGKVVETSGSPAEMLTFSTEPYGDWTWELMKQFGREVRDTLQIADQWSIDGKKKILAYNIGVSHRDEYLDPTQSGADALNVEFGFDPVYSNSSSYFGLENLHTRDSIAAQNGVTFFWTSVPRTVYGNGNTDKRSAIYNNLCFYYVARSDSTWFFARPDPGNAYGVFYNPGFDTLAWVTAMEYDLGNPISHYQLEISGSSPDQNGATYKVWSRQYEYGKVYIRPRDGFEAKWGTTSTLIDVSLDGNYRQLLTDGSLGTVVSSISLVGAAGAIMIPYSSGDCDTPPTVPNLTLPAHGATVSTATPDLCLSNSSQPGDCSQPLRYHFQLANDAGFSQMVAENSSVSEGSSTTCWRVTTMLISGQSYYWRARAGNGFSWSNWSSSRSFAVEIQNDPPSDPGANAPADGDTVSTRHPTLTVNNSSDPEGTTPTYHFQVSTSALFSPLAAEATSVPQGSGTTSWQVDSNLENETAHYWRARAFDGSNYSNWSTARSFFVHDTDTNAIPTAPTANDPTAGETVDNVSPTLALNNATDPDGDPLQYHFQVWNQSESIPLFESTLISGGVSTTAWTINGSLAGETAYKWRARAYDGSDFSDWMAMTLFYTPQQQNQAPTVPVPKSPIDGDTVVGSFHILAVHNSSDPDGDEVTYDFLICSDAAMTKQVEAGLGVEEGQTFTYYYTTTGFAHNRPYFWAARAHDGIAWTNFFATQEFYHLDMALAVEDQAATLVSPTAAATITDNQPLLKATWDGAADSTLFLFEISQTEDFHILVSYGVALPVDQTLSWQVETPLEDNQAYFWRVRQGDGGTSTIQSFTVAAAIHVTPNPFSYYDGEMIFRNLPPNSRVEIFTVTGDPVISFDSAGGDFSWNVLNDSGEKLASGVYLYYVKSGNERYSDKFVVVR